MEIEEKLVEKSINKVAKDPYFTSLEFMKQISDRGKVIEQENSYSTDGPFHRSEVIFELVKELDDHSRVKITYYLTGENGSRQHLRLDVVASFISTVKEEGFFTQVFSEFYLQNVFPIMRKTAEQKIKNLVETSEDIIQKV